MAEGYQLYYWPGIPGRGEFVRLVLEAAEVPYRDVGLEEGVEAVAEQAGVSGAAYHRAPFAPPFLRHGEVLVSQTANCCAYVGEREGLAPEDEAGRRFALGLAMTLEDLVGEVHDTHHPIGPELYYEDQRDAARRRAAHFREVRLPTFLGYLERTVASDPDGWLADARPGYCDLMAFQVMAGLRYAFPERMAEATRHLPGLVRLGARVAEWPAVSAYLTSSRRQPFNAYGIFRHYPELDGPELDG